MKDILRKFKKAAARVTASAMAVVAMGVVSPKQSEAAEVRFAWDPVENVAGYRLYSGLSSRNYSLTVTVPGQETRGSMNLPNVENGEVYYVAATAYNAMALESGYSEEIIIVGDDRGIFTINKTYPAGMGINPAQKVKIFVDNTGKARIVGQEDNGSLALLRTVTARHGYRTLGGNVDVTSSGTFTVASVNNEGTEIWADRYDVYGKLKDSQKLGPYRDSSWVDGDPPNWILIGYDHDNDGGTRFALKNARNGKWREVAWDPIGRVVDDLAGIKDLDAVGSGFVPLVYQMTNDGSRFIASVRGDGRRVNVFQWDGLGVPMSTMGINAPGDRVYNAFAVNRDLSMLRVSFENAAKSVAILAYDPFTYAAVGNPLYGSPMNVHGQMVSLDRGFNGAGRRVWFYADTGHISTVGIDANNLSAGSSVTFYPPESGWMMVGALPATRFATLHDSANIHMVGMDVSGARLMTRSYAKPTGYRPLPGAGPHVGFNGNAKQFLVSDDETKLECWTLNASGMRIKTDNIGPFQDQGGDPSQWKVVSLDTDENGVTGVLLKNAHAADSYRIVTLDGGNMVEKQRDFTLDPSDSGSDAKVYRRTNSGKERVVLMRSLEKGGQGRVMRWNPNGQFVNVMTKTPGEGQTFLDYRFNYDESAERFAWIKANGATQILGFDVNTGLNASWAGLGPFDSGLMPKFLLPGQNKAGGVFAHHPSLNYYRTYNLNAAGTSLGDSVYFQPFSSWQLSSALPQTGAEPSTLAGAAYGGEDSIYAFLRDNVRSGGADAKDSAHGSRIASVARKANRADHDLKSRAALELHARAHKLRMLKL